MAAESEALSPSVEEDRVNLAPQWKLVWWRFRKHRVALLGVGVLSIFFFIGVFPDFLAIHNPSIPRGKQAFVPPQKMHGWWKLRPYVYGFERTRHPVTRRLSHVEDTSRKFPIRFFVRGYEYKLLWLFPTTWHLMGIESEEFPMPFYILGTDRLGRDMYSRMMRAIQLSLSVGLVGMSVSLFLGVLLGGISGYRGGWMDVFIQRVIEFIIAIPTLPLWMVLSAMIPQNWGVVKVYFAITVILSLIGWTGMGRVVRGRFLALREEDFIMAARLSGATELRIILRHMVPSFMSYLITWVSLHIPSIIIGETSLSFLGIGLREPAISLGVLLVSAQNLRTVVLAPWLLIPGLFVIVIILAFNFVGDGLRDAADPYGGK